MQNVFDVSMRLKSFPVTFQCLNVLHVLVPKSIATAKISRLFGGSEDFNVG